MTNICILVALMVIGVLVFGAITVALLAIWSASDD